jgi:uroporphyrinogen III methyltransferase/synthase
LSERDDVSGSRILYVTAEGARDTLREGLSEMGASVVVVEAYRSITDGEGAKKLSRAIEAGNVDLVTFTSGSSVRSYVEAVGAELALRVPAASIGPQTSDAVRNAGIELKVTAEESTIDGLVQAVVRGA